MPVPGMPMAPALFNSFKSPKVILIDNEVTLVEIILKMGKMSVTKRDYFVIIGYGTQVPWLSQRVLFNYIN